VQKVGADASPLVAVLDGEGDFGAIGVAEACVAADGNYPLVGWLAEYGDEGVGSW
jgi:hypothetical protein